jgi:DNA-binding CsgD family transcriptional regulator
MPMFYGAGLAATSPLRAIPAQWPESAIRPLRLAEPKGDELTVPEQTELERGRGAYERHAWGEALAHLGAADAAKALGAEDLLRFAHASYWSGSLDNYLALLERAYTAFVQGGDQPRAALTALKLQWDYLSKPARSLANGWYKRAQRILQACPECVAHGYLAQARLWVALAEGDVEGALREARTMVELGERLGDRDLQVLGLQRQGEVLLAGGDAAGLECLDESVVAAISGELGTMTTAAVYCAAITCCRELGDYERAGQWSAAVTRWCEREACTGFPGLCRIYTAELTCLRGAWAEAQEELRRACEELQRFGAFAMAANAFYELGEIRRRMGDLEGAQAAFAQAYEFGLEPQPGLALVRLAQGDTAAASTAIARALTHPQTNTQRAGGALGQPADRLKRARFLPAQVAIALAAGDLVTARTATDELEAIAADYDTKALHAHACCARSAVARADEDLGRAMAAATDARALWQELDMPYETAHAHMSAAAIHQAVGDDEAAQIELRTAHAIFKRLRADRDRSAAAAQLDKDFRTADPTLGLSARELDVLRLVANGLTDTEIARRLFLSPHTVHRHLANIRAKTNQPSRAAAVAQAARLGLI